METCDRSEVQDKIIHKFGTLFITTVVYLQDWFCRKAGWINICCHHGACYRNDITKAPFCHVSVELKCYCRKQHPSNYTSHTGSVRLGNRHKFCLLSFPPDACILLKINFSWWFLLIGNKTIDLSHRLVSFAFKTILVCF